MSPGLLIRWKDAQKKEQTVLMAEAHDNSKRIQRKMTGENRVPVAEFHTIRRRCSLA